jgi:hypothetical protein
MGDWSWTRRTVQPNDILDAAATIPVRSHRYEADLIPDWTASECYLGWAKDCLSQDSSFGRDAAVCYAKRAACRRIDAFVVCNHFSHLPLNYPGKIETLSKIGLCVHDLVHELVIDPRNQIEHAYSSPTQQEARSAVQLCEMFMVATSEEAKRNAIISIGWSMGITHKICDAPGKEYDLIDFTLRRESSPMLLIDVSDLNEQNVMIIHPGDEEIAVCPLQQFDRSAVVRLATMLRQHYKFEKSGSYGSHKLKRDYLNKLKADIGL